MLGFGFRPKLYAPNGFQTVCVYACMCACVHVCMCGCFCVSLFTHDFACLYSLLQHTHVYTGMHRHPTTPHHTITHTHTHKHTHTHTHTQTWIRIEHTKGLSPSPPLSVCLSVRPSVRAFLLLARARALSFSLARGRTTAYAPDTQT